MYLNKTISIAICLVTILITVVSIPVSKAQTIKYHADFEGGFGPAPIPGPDPVIVTDSQSLNVQINGLQPFSGSNALSQFSYKDGTTNYMRFYASSPGINVTAGKYYLIEIYASDNGTAADFNISSINTDPSSGSWDIFDTDPSAVKHLRSTQIEPDGYYKWEVVWQAPATETRWFAIHEDLMIGGSNASEAFLDDFKITEYDCPIITYGPGGQPTGNYDIGVTPAVNSFCDLNGYETLVYGAKRKDMGFRGEVVMVSDTFETWMTLATSSSCWSSAASSGGTYVVAYEIPPSIDSVWITIDSFITSQGPASSGSDMYNLFITDATCNSPTALFCGQNLADTTIILPAGTVNSGAYLYIADSNPLYAGNGWEDFGVDPDSIAKDVFDICVNEGGPCKEDTFVCSVNDTCNGLAISATVDSNVTCANPSIGQISVNATGGNDTLWYSIDGTNYDTIPVFSNLTAGTYTLYLKDSLCIVNTTAEVKNDSSVYVYDTLSICLQNDSVLLSGGIYAYAPGTYLDTSNCDTFVTSYVSYYPVKSENLTALICSGDSTLIPNGYYVYAPGTYSDTIGCDSIITTIVTLATDTTIFNNYRFCVGDSVLLPGGSGNYAYNTGVYRDTINCHFFYETNVIVDSICGFDLCYYPTDISCGETLSGNIQSATFDDVLPCYNTRGIQNGVWYKFIGTGGYIRLSTCGQANFDSRIDVFEGTCDSLSCVTWNDDFYYCNNYTSMVNFYSEMGKEYYVLVHGYNTERGTFDLTMNCINYPVSGTVFNDDNDNCVQDSIDYGLSGKLLLLSPSNMYLRTNYNGYYRTYLPAGNYSITLISEDSLRDLNCTSNTTSFSITNSGYEANYALHPNAYCPEVMVDAYSWNLRPCRISYYRIYYQNVGTDVASNTDIHIRLDENLSFVSTSGNLTNVNADSSIYTFNVGDLMPGAEGYFYLRLYVDCNLDLVGQTKCISAYVEPDNSCTYAVNTSTEWDKSSVSVEGLCKDDSLACFTITNTGSAVGGAMADSSEYRIYVNDTLAVVGNFKLTGQGSIEICYPANANTIRLEADQRPGHPGNSQPRDHVEACGTPDPTFSLGYVLTSPQDDADNFVDIECNVITNSYDPNEKEVRPLGITQQYRYIDSTEVLEYVVHFQNTGTDTAFKVVITDTLSEYLDITTYQHLQESHDVEITFLADNVVKWSFYDINLPDSATDLEGSNGFVKFKIEQVEGNTRGALIENNVDIYFDYNSAVRTNTVFNTVGKLTFTLVPEKINVENYLNARVYPNPFKDVTNLEVDNIYNRELEITIADLTGRNIYYEKGVLNSLQIHSDKFVSGTYILTISDGKTREQYKLIAK